MKEKSQVADIDRSVYDIRDKEDNAYRMQEGLTPEIIDKLSKEKDDPVWMQQFRLGRRFILDAGFRHFDVCGFGGANSWDISGAKQQSAIKEEILSRRSLERINYI